MKLLFVLVLAQFVSTYAADSVTASIYIKNVLSPQIPPNYIGFSLEHNIALSWFGYKHVRPSFTNLLLQLKQTPNQPSTIFRIGGDSTTHSWWNPFGQPLPKLDYDNGDYNISFVDLLSQAAAMKSIDGKLVIGINHRLPNDVSWALAHVQAIATTIGWKYIAGLEVGNEPELYAPRYRPEGYNISQYIAEFAAYAKQIAGAVPEMPTKIWQGCAFAGVTEWVEAMPDIVKAYNAILINVAHHHYYECADANPPPTMADLLSDKAALKEMLFITNKTNNVIGKVEAAGSILIVGEGNSACHSGMPNVSDVFAITLWALDNNLNNVLVGESQFLYHSHDRVLSHYPPLIWQSDTDDTPTVRPLWYGLKMFALTTANYSSLVEARLVNSTNNLIKVWAVMSSTNIVSILVLHKDLDATESATITIDLTPSMSTFPDGTLIRLESFSPYSQNGIKLAGQTYDGTQDGLPLGQYESETVQSVQGYYTFQIKPISAVLIQFKNQFSSFEQ